MALKAIKLRVQDEVETFRNRFSSFKKWIDGCSNDSRIDDEPMPDDENVSILNLPSLKKGNMMSKTPSAKLELISQDKQRLNTWIENYKVQFEKSGDKDSVKIATFREAATRLKMLFDHNDFDEGDYRVARRKAITEINDMLGDISGF